MQQSRVETTDGFFVDPVWLQLELRVTSVVDVDRDIFDIGFALASCICGCVGCVDKTESWEHDRLRCVLRC